VFIVCYTKTESEKEEKQHTIDICLHIGPDSNDRNKKTAHESEFQRRLKQPWRLTKLYLSSKFNSDSAATREAVIQHICGMFDCCGGGIISTGTSESNKIVFRCFWVYFAN